MSISHFLRSTAPDFMWCSVFDLYLMYEQIDEDVEWNNFRQRFYQLKRHFVKKGKFYMRKNNQSNADQS